MKGAARSLNERSLRFSLKRFVDPGEAHAFALALALYQKVCSPGAGGPRSGRRNQKGADGRRARQRRNRATSLARALEHMVAEKAQPRRKLWRSITNPGTARCTERRMEKPIEL